MSQNTNFRRHSENFYKLYNIKFYSVQIASEGLVLMLQLETIEKSHFGGKNDSKIGLNYIRNHNVQKRYNMICFVY